MKLIREYYRLTKPGIIYGNLLSTIAAFLFASKGHLDINLFLATNLGTALVIGSGCVFNNYLDRDIDSKMTRTKIRALVLGTIATKNAIIFATILGLVGFTVLARFTNNLTVLVGLVGFFDYVVVYWFGKRYSNFGTIIGSIAGATPIVAGYTAVTNQFDLSALLLFLLMVFWQMPHFYAISIYRIDEYAKANIPVLPSVKSMLTTKIHILFYCLAFTVSILVFTILAKTSLIFLIVMLLSSLGWTFFSLQSFYVDNDKRWARKMFFASLIILLVFSAMLVLDVYLP